MKGICMTGGRSRRYVLIVGMLVLPCTTGCLSPKKMRPVAQAGIQAACLAKQATAEMRDNLASFRETRYLTAALRGADEAGDLEARAAVVDEIQKLLLARLNMLTQLERMYRTLAALADYDAAAELDGAVGRAASALASYAGRANAGSITTFADKVAAQIVSAMQQGRLAKANEGLAELIEEIAKQLEREQASRKALALIVQTGHENLLMELLAHRVCWSHDLLAAKAAELGLTYDPEQWTRIYEERAKDKEALATMNQHLIQAHMARTNQLAAAEEDVMEESIDAFRALARAHRRLAEDSRHIDLAELGDLIEQLRTVYEEAKRIAEELDEAREAARQEVKKPKRVLREAAEEALRNLITNSGMAPTP